MPENGKEYGYMSIKEQLRQPRRDKHISGHSMTAPERYTPDTRHMVIMNVIKDHAGYKTGGCVRLFLSDEGYNEVMQTDGRGNVKIIRHARVRMGALDYDTPERGEK